MAVELIDAEERPLDRGYRRRPDIAPPIASSERLGANALRCALLLSYPFSAAVLSYRKRDTG